MWMMLQIIPIMWRAVRPSRVADMPAVVNSFWLRKGFEGLTFFGKILTPTQALADEFNTGFNALKNHEMIHLRQAQACGDSWLRFYLLYLWYWLRALPANRKLKHGAYLRVIWHPALWVPVSCSGLLPPLCPKSMLSVKI